MNGFCGLWKIIHTFISILVVAGKTTYFTSKSGKIKWKILRNEWMQWMQNFLRNRGCRVGNNISALILFFFFLPFVQFTSFTLQKKTAIKEKCIKYNAGKSSKNVFKKISLFHFSCTWKVWFKVDWNVLKCYVYVYSK
jgi:hypothetical protein